MMSSTRVQRGHFFASFDQPHDSPSSDYPLVLYGTIAMLDETLDEDCLVRVLSVDDIDVNATFEEFGSPATVLCLAAHDYCLVRKEST